MAWVKFVGHYAYTGINPHGLMGVPLPSKVGAYAVVGLMLLLLYHRWGGLCQGFCQLALDIGKMGW